MSDDTGQQPPRNTLLAELENIDAIVKGMKTGECLSRLSASRLSLFDAFISPEPPVPQRPGWRVIQGGKRDK